MLLFVHNSGSIHLETSSSSKQQGLSQAGAVSGQIVSLPAKRIGRRIHSSIIEMSD
jgi:hypothetical protein